MAWMVDKLFKDDKLPGTLRAASCKSVQEFHRWVRQRDDYSRMFYREVRVSPTINPTQLCAMLTSPAPAPGLGHAWV